MNVRTDGQMQQPAYKPVKETASVAGEIQPASKATMKTAPDDGEINV